MRARKHVISARSVGCILFALLFTACATQAPAPPGSPPAAPATAAPAATSAAPAPTAAPAPKRGGTINLISVGEPAHMDIHKANWNLPLWAFLGQSLVRYDNQGNPTPELATKWRFDNPQTLVFTIREGVKFHNLPPVNGRELTAEDVAFSLNRIRTPRAEFIWASQFERVDKIEAVDKYTVRMTLKSPFAPILSYIASGTVSSNKIIIAPESIQKWGDLADIEHAVGTGPFQIQQFTPGVGGTAVRNPSYWEQGRPYADGVSITSVPDRATMIAAYRTGKIDFGTQDNGDLALSEKDDLKRTNPEIQYTDWSRPNWFGLVPNLNNKLFQDIRIRKAIFLAIDRQEALKLNLGGGGYLTGPLPQRMFPGWAAWTDEELLKLPGYRQPKDQDIAEAKRLLAEAGYSNGLTVEAEGTNLFPQINLKNMEIAKSQLAKAGITVNIKLVDGAIWFGQDTKGDFGFRARGYSASRDPDDQLYSRHHSTGGRNYQKLNDPDLDKLLDAQRQELDIEKRKDLVKKAQVRLMDLAPQVWLHTAVNYMPRQPWVRGLEQTEYDPFWLPSNIWINK